MGKHVVSKFPARAPKEVHVKTAVITGITAGIGRATAHAFAENGWTIFGGARRKERFPEVIHELKSAGAEDVQIFPLDVALTESCIGFEQLVSKQGKQIDVFVNNAGLAIGNAHLSQVKLQDIETMVDTNLVGVLKLTRLFLPLLLQQKQGHFIFLGSIAGHEPYEGGTVYCATKAAVKSLIKSLRSEVSGEGIRVTTIDPGMVETEFSIVRFQDAKRAKSVYQGMTPLTPQDIADAIYYAATRPPHVNVEEMILMPTEQASVYKTFRK